MTARERALTVQGWMDPDELDWLAEQAAKAPRVLEVGALKGRSTIVLAASTPGVVCTVDPYQSRDPILAEEFHRVGADALRVQFWQNVRPWESKITLYESGHHLRDQRPDPFDFIFIDGEHDEMSVAMDLFLYLPLLRPGGVLAGHDYVRPSVQWAVKRFVPWSVRQPVGSIWEALCPGMK